MPFDLVIRGGVVVDGSGLVPYRSDVAIERGRISAIGHIREKGRQEIDAEGHVVTPGFIDGHTHMDAQVFWDPLGTCSCWHGVTTVVMGHCGFTLAPVRRSHEGMVIRNLERAEDISPAALAAGINWTWETFEQYLDTIDRLPKGINYAANVGHSALRTWAMGERAFEDPATDDDLAAMERELRAALHGGAIGFSTTRSTSHKTSDDRPVASRLASWEEVRYLVHTMSDVGAGIFQITPETVAQSPDPSERKECFERLRDLALESLVPMTFGITCNPAGLASLELIESTTAAGGRMFGMTHSRGTSIILSFKTHLPFDVLPEWKPIRDLPIEEQKRALANSSVRTMLVEAAHNGNYGQATGTEARKPDYDRMRVLDRSIPPNPSVAEVANSRRCDPIDAMIDLSLETDFDQLFIQSINPINTEDLLATLRHPGTVMTFSDSGAHVSQISDCSIQSHLLAYWVRDREEFTLEEAIRMLTLAPARAWGFSDRGLIREGMAADINVFDPTTVAPDLPMIVNDLPGGAQRLRQAATGFLATIVNGEISLTGGESTGATPGRLLRGPLARNRS